MFDRSSKAREFLAKIAPTSGLESVGLDEVESITETAQLGSAQRKVVRTTVEKVATGQELSPAEQFTLEAIIIPDKRPAIDIVNGDFVVRHPLWMHYAGEPIRSTIRKVLPSIGRVEVSGIPGLPFGGTGFVVGAGLLMTNRHVAELFSTGLGRDGLVFRPGIRAGVDFRRERGRDERQHLRVRRVLMIHPYWDLALLLVDGLSERNPPLVLALERPEQLVGRDVAVVGYPAFDPRNPADVQNQVFGSVYNVKRLQPGKLGPRRTVRSFGHPVSAMTHDASTLGGNSGSAVVEVAGGTVVALHFAGAYLDANFTVPSWELSRDQRVIEAGVRFRNAVQGDAAVTGRWWGAVEAAPPSAPPAGSPPAGTAREVSLSAGEGMTWTIPIQITVRVGAGAQIAATAAAAAPVAEPMEPLETEKVVAPVHDPDYSTRTGYDREFLGIDVPMPEPVDEALCALLEDGNYVLPYHHFSLVMHKHRRLTMLTAANLDAHPDRKEPEPGKLYTRKALGGLGKNDIELWFTDPRIAPEEQLPDRFFSKDRQAFDRGHVVRREDVAWGHSYQEVRYANGDTFHTTNCTPQVAGFNQAAENENWGDLEKYVSSEARSDRLSVFAGSVLAEDDPVFVGVDDDGPVRVQIPRQYWKVILAEDHGELRAFAFLLRQDLTGVPLEFAVDAAWREHMIAIGDLEDLLGIVRFPEVVWQADQAHTDAGEAVRGLAGIELAEGASPRELARPTPNSGDDESAEPGSASEYAAAELELEAVTAWRVARSLARLRGQVDARAPRRSKASDGTIGDAAHATRSSDHNPWVRDGRMGVVTAMDITHDPANGCDAGALAEAIRASRDSRVKYIIWNRRIASSSVIGGVAAWTWRRYNGSNPHSRHVHVSVLPGKTAFDSEAAWAI